MKQDATSSSSILCASYFSLPLYSPQYSINPPSVLLTDAAPPHNAYTNDATICSPFMLAGGKSRLST